MSDCVNAGIVPESEDSLARITYHLDRHWRWEDEDMFFHKKGMSPSDRRVIALWESKHVVLSDNHYELLIPFRQAQRSLTPSRLQAERRLSSLLRKLAKYPELALKYTSGIRELLVQGYAEDVTSLQTKDGCWYTPHHLTNIKAAAD